MTTPAEWTHIDTLRPWGDNPWHHPLDQVEALADLILEHGWTAPIVAQQSTGMILAGHARRLAALQLIARDVDWQLPDAPEPGHIPVRFLDVDDDEGADIAIADNMASERAELDGNSLATILRAHLEDDVIEQVSRRTAMEAKHIRRVLRAQERSQAAVRPQTTWIELEPPDEPVSKPGDVYKLGPHVLVCGDSTDRDVGAQLLKALGVKLVQLVVTDPPYAIYGSSTGVGSDMMDDKISRPFFLKILRQIDRILPVFGQAIVCCDWRSYASWWECTRQTNLRAKNCVVWDKGSSGKGSSFTQTHEFGVYLVKAPPAKAMSTSQRTGQPLVQGFRNLVTVGRTSGEDRNHNAAKPQELLEYFLRAVDSGHDEPGVQVVVDLFGGGGSTMIACQTLGKRAGLVEIEPGWCDVIRKRWGDHARANDLEVGDGL